MMKIGEFQTFCLKFFLHGQPDCGGAGKVLFSGPARRLPRRSRCAFRGLDILVATFCVLTRCGSLARRTQRISALIARVKARISNACARMNVHHLAGGQIVKHEMPRRPPSPLAGVDRNHPRAEPHDVPVIFSIFSSSLFHSVLA
jgi:hypothetical protein